MSGGSLYQDVDNHAIGGTHPLCIVDGPSPESPINATSTHHQQMRVGDEGTLVATGGHRSTYRKHMVNGEVTNGSMEEEDVEVVFYHMTDALCFQPHPEYVDKDDPFQDYYFKLLEHYLMLTPDFTYYEDEDVENLGFRVNQVEGTSEAYGEAL